MTAVSGRLRVTPGGFGILVYDVGVPYGGTAGGVAEDAFVPPPLLDGCLDADRVDATVDIDPDDGRGTVSVLTVTGRQRRLIAGRLRWRDGRASLVPNRLVARRPLRLPDHLLADVDGLDDGAVLVAALEPFDARRGRIDIDHIVCGTPDGDGDVAIRMTTIVTDLDGERPDHPADAAVVDLWTEAALLDEDRPAIPEVDGVGDDSIVFATALPTATVPIEGRPRRDTHPVTIDGPTTVDFDDAVDAVPDGDGWQVRVHIADPGALASPDDWRWALAASQSVYLPSGRIDLLPTDLAAGRASLVAGEERPCLTIAFRVSADGSIRDVDLSFATVTVDTRCTYAQVDRHLDGDRVGGAAGTTLDHVVAAAERIGAERERRGLFPELFPEPEFEPTVDDTGRIVLRATEATVRASLVVERLMVAANEAAGGFLHDRGWPGLYRSHPAPSTEAVARLDAFVDAHGLVQRFGTEAVSSDEGLHLPRLAHLAAEVATADPDLHLGLLAVLAASTRPATNVTRPAAHFGLGADAYLQATSPIRRVTDLVNHRLVAAALASQGSPPSDHAALESWLQRLAGWVARRDRVINLAQRRERNRMLGVVLGTAIDAGRPLKATATVVGIGQKHLTVHLLRLGLRGRLPASELGSETWDVDDHRMSVMTDAGPIWMGAPLRVAVTRCFPDTGDADVSLVG